MLSLGYLKMWDGFWVHLGGGAGLESGACTDLCPGFAWNRPLSRGDCGSVMSMVYVCGSVRAHRTHCQLLKGRLALVSLGI